jgi:NADH-quinone oxidoreductase subunit J
VHGALMLVLNLLAVAGLYVTLESPFLGIIQVLVYGGAIMVLFLFVIMLLGVSRDDLLVASTSLSSKVLATVGAALLAGALLFGFVGPYTQDASVCGEAGAGEQATSQTVRCRGLAQAVEDHEQGSVGLLGELLFTRYTFPFELAALLLTVATIGATVLGRRRDLVPDDPGGIPEEGPGPGATEAASLEGADRPAEHGLPARPDRDREV